MRNKISNLLWGLVFIASGVIIAGNILFDWNFHINFKVIFALILIIPCLASIIRSGFSLGATIGLLIGAMILIDQYVDFNESIWKLIVPFILIVIGLRIAFQGAFNKPRGLGQGEHIDGESNYYTSNNKEYSAIFAGNKIIITDRFVGTNLNAIFGGITLDLRNAIIDRDVEITATAVFGGIDIYIPNGVSVKVNNVPVFGGVSDKTLHNAAPNAYTIYLNSTTMFGGIDIK